MGIAIVAGLVLSACGPHSPNVESVTAAGVIEGANAKQKLVELSDPERVQTPLDLYRNLEAISDHMVAQKDPAGMFPLAYVAVSKQAWEALQGGQLQDPRMTSALMVDFGRRFLKPLAAYARGQNPGDVWASYYQVAKDNGKPTERTLGMGFNAHLSLDLAESLAFIKAPTSYRAEYLRLGQALFQANPEIAASMKARYGHSCDNLLQGFAIGRGLDRVIGDGNSAKLTFQIIRQEAWTQGQLLQKSKNPDSVRRGMRQAFEWRNTLLARLKH